MSDIFISYARTDRARVAPIAAALEAEGFTVWWDPDIEPGETFRGEIEQALKAASCVVVVWSAVAVHRNWVIEEAEEGLARGVLVPIVIDNVADIPRGFKSVQAADLARWNGDPDDASWQLVLARVRRLKAPSALPRPQARTRYFKGLASPIVFGSLALATALFGTYFALPSARNWIDVKLGRTGGMDAAIVLQIGSTFTDCAGCPEMVVVPAGSFPMGSFEQEEGHQPNESPVHKATIARPFAISKFEITVEQWNACAADAKCPPRNDPVSRGRQPAAYVTWIMAQQYLAWLREKTGKNYRLPTETEWEYAARAGSTASYFFGDNEADLCTYANGSDLSTPITTDAQGDQHNFWRNKQCADAFPLESAPVGSFRPNAFGLYDMLGNMREWVADCFHETYGAAPLDGSAVTTNPCDARVLRGGGWSDSPWDLRVAHRTGQSPEEADDDVGLRVVRSLDPGESDH
jgi:formylglycine-generating enzyme required for sulfatase activity